MTPDPIRAALERLIEAVDGRRWDAKEHQDALAAARAALAAASVEPASPTNQELHDLAAHCIKGSKSVEWVILQALARWGRPVTPPAPAADLPPDYIDEWITDPSDRSLLEVFHKACNSEGGSADEVILRGLKAVLQDGRSRSYRLQQENRRFREPERTILCDILANGTLLPDPDGTRYGIPPAPAAGEVGQLAAWLYRLADERTCNRRRGIRPHPSALTRAAVLLEQLAAQARAPQPVPVPVSERLPGVEDCDAEGYIWLWDTERRWVRQYREAASSNTWVGASWLPAHALPLPTTTPAGQEGV